ncbi:MAG: FGGY-family carbohydrate kinase [Elainella sp. Prado103]|nr:FGGY-family carbohydrate kinase [Elainella sp. Prado103]
MQPLSLGIDFGTSGARAIVLDPLGQIQAQSSIHLSEQTTAEWQSGLETLIGQIPLALRRQIRSVAVDGTSSTVLLCDVLGHPLDTPILYFDDRGRDQLGKIQQIASTQPVVISATSSLAKVLWWVEQARSITTMPYLLHQADWLAFLLHGQLGISDYHNALKLGYDVEQLCYPDWLLRLNLPIHLPQVFPPGTAIGCLRSAWVETFQFPPDCVVCAGTTDSIAAFLASGASQPGEAVTSLGSTLVLKLLSHIRIEESATGIYSHRLGQFWLVGGASNTGGAVLQQFFSPAELQALSRQIQPDRPSQLHYYPLLKPGERFPINDPNLAPCLSPRPADPKQFLQGLLEGIARIEAEGYQRLQQLGATTLSRVYTAGGGAQNATWTQIRSRHLQVPVQISPQTEAAYGTARLCSLRLCA